MYTDNTLAARCTAEKEAAGVSPAFKTKQDRAVSAAAARTHLGSIAVSSPAAPSDRYINVVTWYFVYESVFPKADVAKWLLVQ